MDDFIRSGGSVFVDTGWEYQSADWNSGETPAFFPVTNLTWTNYGKADDYRVGGELFETDDIKTSDIEPLVWQDLPWGISGGGSVREWAQPILSVSEGVLIAGGEYGDGRIVWSGMNTLGHIKEFDSQKPENMLMGKIMNYLLRDSSSHILKKDEDFSLKRPNPDRVEVTLHRDIPSGYGLFFKESYFPYWNASNDLEIEYAGPGFMYVDLPEMTQGETIIFSMGIMPAQIWGHIASALGVLGAALYLKGVVKFGFLSKINSPKIGLSNPVKGILDNSEDTDY